MPTMRDLPTDAVSSGPLLRGYDPGPFYDEMFSVSHGLLTPRPHYRDLAHDLAQLTPADLARASDLANRSFLHQGITFTVYSDAEQGADHEQDHELHAELDVVQLVRDAPRGGQGEAGDGSELSVDLRLGGVAPRTVELVHCALRAVVGVRQVYLRVEPEG